MGIEKFFNVVRKQYNIVQDIYHPYNKIRCEHFFIDFNSIIHFVSQDIIANINAKMLEELEKLGENEEQMSNLQKSYNDKYTNKYMNRLITKAVIDQLLSNITVLINPHFLKTLYIGIDGIPSKSKMAEQKNRRYSAEYFAKMQEQIAQRYKNKLTPHQRWYEAGKIRWSKSNITVGTPFMHYFCEQLKSKATLDAIHHAVPKIEQIIISDVYEPGEGEIKIFRYLLGITGYKPTDNIIVYSPDADMILLCLLTRFENLSVLRYDQQLSETDDHAVYNHVDIDKLKLCMVEYIRTTHKIAINAEHTDVTSVYRDIVFIFTIFGDDFLHKIESYNVKNDIQLLFDKYAQLLAKTQQRDDKYIITPQINGKRYTINYPVFIMYLHLLSADEPAILRRNYYQERYANYNHIIKSVTIYLAKNHIHKYKTDNIEQFIEDYNCSRILDALYVATKVRKEDEMRQTVYKIYPVFLHNIKERDGLTFTQLIEKIKNNTKKHIMIRHYLLYSADISVDRIVKDPFHAAHDVKLMELKPFVHSINNPYHKKITSGMNDYEKEIYKLEKLLDEYHELSGDSEIKTSAEYYRAYFDIDANNHIALYPIVEKYITGLTWINDYYFNDVMYTDWYYDINGAPLITEIYRTLLMNKTAIKNVTKNISTYTTEIEFTPLEQLIFITPWNTNNHYLLDMVNKQTKQQLIKYIDSSDDFVKIDIDNKNNIDCRGAKYFNKCIVRNKYDHRLTIAAVRHIISLEEQAKIFKF